MRRNHNTRRIIGSRYYDFKDIAKLYGIHPRTVQRWHKIGLKVVDESSRPYLVLGNELRKFLGNQKDAIKLPLSEEGFYCLKCRDERNGAPGSVIIVKTGKRVGRDAQQIIRKGTCEICGAGLCRFSTDQKEDNHDI